jgi:hypothetical protein
MGNVIYNFHINFPQYSTRVHSAATTSETEMHITHYCNYCTYSGSPIYLIIINALLMPIILRLFYNLRMFLAFMTSFPLWRLHRCGLHYIVQSVKVLR